MKTENHTANITEQTLAQKYKVNVDLIKKNMTEKTTLPSLRNQDLEKSEGRNRKD